MDSFVDYLLLQVLENLILCLFLWGPLLELVVLCVFTLCRLPAQRRREVSALFAALLVLAEVLFGGAWVLDRCGLAWRTWFQEGLSVLLWLVGLVTGIATVGYAGRWLMERSRAVKNVVIGLSAFCLVSAMLVGTVMGGLWAFGPSEQVVTYAGEKMILGEWGWSSGYQLYAYYGPLVRGAEPAVVDWDWTLVEGAVINAW